MYFDFLIPKRPVSSQTRQTSNLQEWKQYVRSEAAKSWTGQVLVDRDIQLTLVYLYKRDPLDTDNIIKPIQDALIGLVYENDSLITDVVSSRRLLYGTFDSTLPDYLFQGIVQGIECVYVRVSESKSLEEYL